MAAAATRAGVRPGAGSDAGGGVNRGGGAERPRGAGRPGYYFVFLRMNSAIFATPFSIAAADAA